MAVTSTTAAISGAISTFDEAQRTRASLLLEPGGLVSSADMPEPAPVIFSFRPLTRRDLPLLHEWLNRPHVAEWWEGTTGFEYVEQTHGADLDSNVGANRSLAAERTRNPRLRKGGVPQTARSRDPGRTRSLDGSDPCGARAFFRLEILGVLSTLCAAIEYLARSRWARAECHRVTGVVLRSARVAGERRDLRAGAGLRWAEGRWVLVAVLEVARAESVGSWLATSMRDACHSHNDAFIGRRARFAASLATTSEARTRTRAAVYAGVRDRHFFAASQIRALASSLNTLASAPSSRVMRPTCSSPTGVCTKIATAAKARIS